MWEEKRRERKENRTRNMKGQFEGCDKKGKNIQRDLEKGRRAQRDWRRARITGEGEDKEKLH